MRVIDTWVNVNIGGEGRPEFLRRVAKDYFKRDDEDFFRSYGVDEMPAMMDRLEVEKAILTTVAHRPDPTVLQCAKSHPDRFALGAQLDPTQPMKAVRALDLRPGALRVDHTAAIGRGRAPRRPGEHPARDRRRS